MTQTNPLIPIHRPLLPSAEEILPYLKEIDNARWYSNFGPLLRKFEARLADNFNIDTDMITSACNGTMMLTAILECLNLPEKSLCIMPSWTFIATAAAAHQAQLTPYFVDVDQHTQALNPEILLQEIQTIKKPIGAVIVIAPFGAPINIAAWENFQTTTGISVIIDAAAAFDSVSTIKEMAVSELPTMISLHATKVFGVGEGGIVLSKNKKLVSQIKSFLSFGFDDGREAKCLGVNGKLSEYSAAVGLAALDAWSQTKKQWEEVRDNYIQHLELNNITHKLSPHWISGTCNIVIPNQAKALNKQLAATNINTRQWWLDGCHTHAAYQHFPRSKSLSNTEWLSASVLGIPYSMDITLNAITRICLEIKSFINSKSISKSYLVA